MQLYYDPPRTMLIAIIESYIFINGITVARIIVTASCWLLFISELRCVYLQDRFMHLNSLIKNLHKASLEMTCNRYNGRNIISNQRIQSYNIHRLLYFLHSHNSLCWFLNKMNGHWSECNMLCMVFNIPNNAMMTNLLLFQKFDARRFLVLFLFTVIQFVMATIAIGIIPPIHYYAIGCRQHLFFCLCRFSQYTRPILSVRLQLKSFVYVERVTSPRMEIGIEIAPRQPVITYASYWQVNNSKTIWVFFLLMIFYFIHSFLFSTLVTLLGS